MSESPVYVEKSNDAWTVDVWLTVTEDVSVGM
jgi:hypothetical protein